jgi:hypothetical protein
MSYHLAARRPIGAVDTGNAVLYVGVVALLGLLALAFGGGQQRRRA